MIKKLILSKSFFLDEFTFEKTFREAFKIFDRDKDGYIDMKELKKVTTMLGSMLTKEEVEEFMAEADVVNVHILKTFQPRLAQHNSGYILRTKMRNQIYNLIHKIITQTSIIYISLNIKNNT